MRHFLGTAQTNRLLYAALLLTALLAACGSGPTVPLPDATSVTLNGSERLKLNAPVQLSATARDAAGQVINGKTFDWTSSDPSVVSVDGGGTVTAQRLSVAPVTLTATANGQSSSLNVTTYGLELTVGTYNHEPGQSSAQVWTTVLLKFRKANGTGPDVDAPVNFSGPGTFGHSKPGDWLVARGPAPAYDWGWYDRSPVAGEYSASASVDGEPYTATASLDPTALLPGFDSATLDITSRSASAITYSLGGSPTPEVQAVGGALMNAADATEVYLFGVRPSAALPLVDMALVAPKAGRYTKLVYALNADPANFTSVTPAQFNMSRVSIGTVTLP